MRLQTIGVLSLAALAMLFVSPAKQMRADDVIFTNFNPSQTYVGSSWWDVGAVSGAPGGQVVAFSFTPTATETLTGADLAVSMAEGTTTQTPLTVFIESNSGGSPGAIIDELTQSGTQPVYPFTGVVNFTCTLGCSTLNAGTEYWIVAQQSDPLNTSDWMYSFGDTGTWFYNQLNSETGPWTAATAGNRFSAFDITGSTSVGVVLSNVDTPEPASLALLGSGLLGIVAASRRRAWRR